MTTRQQNVAGAQPSGGNPGGLGLSSQQMQHEAPIPTLTNWARKRTWQNKQRKLGNALSQFGIEQLFWKDLYSTPQNAQEAQASNLENHEMKEYVQYANLVKQRAN